MTENNYVAQLRRALQATEQALSDERIGAQNAEVMAYAALPVVTAWRDTSAQSAVALMVALDALDRAHDATTPSPMQTHVVVTVEEKALADAAKLVGKEWFAGVRPEGKPGHLAWNALLGAYRATLAGTP